MSRAASGLSRISNNNQKRSANEYQYNNQISQVNYSQLDSIRDIQAELERLSKDDTVTDYDKVFQVKLSTLAKDMICAIDHWYTTVVNKAYVSALNSGQFDSKVSAGRSGAF